MKAPVAIGEVHPLKWAAAPVAIGEVHPLKWAAAPVAIGEVHQFQWATTPVGEVQSVQRFKTKVNTIKFKSHDFITSFTNHTNWVRSVRYFRDDRLLRTVSNYKTIRFYDAFQPGGAFAVTISEDAKVKFFGLVEGRPIFTLSGPRSGILTTAFSPD
ncbi:unnamed protein product [Orchesella dallaii]|uniref:Uncharacterized protein n=1 Tax=Orchesella dallaii TaxID=48710 RepID=A0ABP1PQR8_9HEXA